MRAIKITRLVGVASTRPIYIPLNMGPRDCSGRVRGYNALDGRPVSLSPEQASGFRPFSVFTYGGRVHRRWLSISSYQERWRRRCTCPACTRK